MRGRWWWLWTVLYVGLAEATTIVPMSDADLVAASDLVVVGRVERIESVLLGSSDVRTRVTIGVEEVVKGEPGSASVVVTQPGGEVAGLRAVVFGVPEWTTGEHAVAFLTVRPDGSLVPTALALGKWTIESTAAGAVARRAGPHEPTRSLAAVTSRLAALAAGQTARRTDGRAGAGIEPPTWIEVTDAFSLSRVNGRPSRWFEPDCARAIVYDRAGADAVVGDAASAAALEQAAAAWSGAGAAMALAAGVPVPAGPTFIGGTADGRNVVVFDDPFDEVPDVVGCTGVLAMGGFVSASADDLPETSRTVNGETFMKVFEGDVVVNPGVAQCVGGATGLAEVLTHEIGHSIGFGHSSENPNESDPDLADATMYFRAHGDGRGAVVRTDDLAALQLVYPTSAQATTPVAQAACEVAFGLFNASCSGVQISTVPFNRMAKAKKAADKAAAATTAGKQRRFLKKTLKALAKTDAAIAKLVPGSCGAGMRANVQRSRDRVNAALAGL